TGSIQTWLWPSTMPNSAGSTGPKTVVTTGRLISRLQRYPQIRAVGGSGKGGHCFAQRKAAGDQRGQVQPPRVDDVGGAQAVVGAARRRAGDDQLAVMHDVGV